MVLFRLLLILVLAGGVALVLVRLLRRRRAPRSVRLTAEELVELGHQAKDSPELAEAMRLRARLLDVARPDPAGVLREADEAIRQLAVQVRTRRQIDAAVRDMRSRGESERTEADARSQAPVRQERLDAQRAQIEHLDGRRKDLARAAEDIVMELRDVHLALLEAASSKADLGSDRARRMRARLQVATDDLKRRAGDDE